MFSRALWPVRTFVAGTSLQRVYYAFASFRCYQHKITEVKFVWCFLELADRYWFKVYFIAWPVFGKSQKKISFLTMKLGSGRQFYFYKLYTIGQVDFLKKIYYHHCYLLMHPSESVILQACLMKSLDSSYFAQAVGSHASSILCSHLCLYILRVNGSKIWAAFFF